MSDPDDIPTIAGPRAAGPWPVPNEVSGGRYRIERLLGRGGQKQVYLARDVRLERDVVLSFLRANSPELSARIRREAVAMSRLGDHPNIVTIYDIGEEAGAPFIVSQYIEGGSLEQLMRLADHRRPPLDEVLRVGRELCGALEHAHRLGVVHRDLKPGNVFLTKDRTVKLGDFGLAVGEDLARVTSEGILVGTVGYIAPERLLGQVESPHSDLYSLGVMLYELVTGRLPFVGEDTLSVISQHLHEPPIAPSWLNPQVPPELEALILRLLVKQPDGRPRDATAVAAALRAIATGTTAPATPLATPRLERLAGGVFIGRESELATLRALLSDASSGHGCAALLVGYAGSGKTRTAEQVLTYARVRGMTVLRGQCHEGEGAPAYWPWIQVLRACVAVRTASDPSADLAGAATVIAQLDVELRRALAPGAAELPALEPDQARFRLFDAVTTFLKAESRAHPLVLLLDDLHWADRASLLLLRFFLRELHDAAIMVLGTHRDVSDAGDQSVPALLAELPTFPRVSRLVLPGLSEPDVARFMEMMMGTKPPPALVAATMEKTGGNPFFVTEVVRLVVTEGPVVGEQTTGDWNIAIPDSVREVVGRRVAVLTADCRQVLTVSAVAGRDIALTTLEDLCDLPGERLAEALDEAVSARVLSEVRERRGVFRFSHALLRDALYEQIPAGRRSRLHLRLGEWLERLPPADLDARLGEAAHHFLQAGLASGVGKAVSYSVKAAARAVEVLAYEEAVSAYGIAVEALQRFQPANVVQRCDLLLAKGDAAVKAGIPGEGRSAFRRAAQLASSLRDPQRLARAALGVGSGSALRRRLGQSVDQEEVRLLKEALQLLAPDEVETRTLVLAQLSLAHYHETDARLEFSRQAIDLASNDRARAAALYAHCVALEGLPHAKERLAAADELVRIAESVGDIESSLRGRTRRVRELMELGDVKGAREEVAAYAVLAEGLRQPRYLWYVPFFEAAMCVLQGEFGAAGAPLSRATEIGNRAQDTNLAMFLAALKYQQLNLQGRFEEVEPMVKKLIATFPVVPAWRAVLSRVYAALGRLDDAYREFERLAADEFASIPHDGAYLVALAALSFTSWRLGDAVRAERVYALLEPYGRVTVVTGNVPICGGATDQYLGLCAASMSKWDEATRHFEEAISFNRQMGAHPYAADTAYDYATMLLARRGEGDLGKARDLLKATAVESRSMGMSWVAREAEARLSGLS